MTATASSPGVSPVRGLMLAGLINLVWINASEVFRYFAFVMPMMRAALATTPHVAPMSVPVFLIWGAWDTIVQAALMGFVWIYLQRFGYGVRNALTAGALFWLAVFGVLWLGLFNMNLATPAILGVALPLALVEMLVAAVIVNWALSRQSAAA